VSWSVVPHYCVDVVYLILYIQLYKNGSRITYTHEVIVFSLYISAYTFFNCFICIQLASNLITLIVKLEFTILKF